MHLFMKGGNRGSCPLDLKFSLFGGLKGALVPCFCFGTFCPPLESPKLFNPPEIKIYADA